MEPNKNNENYKDLVDTLNQIEKSVSGSRFLRMNLQIREVVPIIIFIAGIVFGIGSN
jgi:hypothetical protein